MSVRVEVIMFRLLCHGDAEAERLRFDHFREVLPGALQFFEFFHRYRIYDRRRLLVWRPRTVPFRTNPMLLKDVVQGYQISAGAHRAVLFK